MDKITHSLIFNHFEIEPTEDHVYLNHQHKNIIAGFGFVDLHGGVYEALLDDEQQKIYDEQDSQISIDDALKGVCVDLTQFFPQEELDEFLALDVCWAFRNQLHHIGVTEEDDIENLVHQKKLTVQDLARNHYGTLWAIQFNR